MKKIIRFLCSMQFGMILLALVIACSVAGSVIVQQREPMEYVNRYGEDAARLILVLKLNDVFSSVYFLVLMAALCLNLTLCSIVRLPRTMKDGTTITVEAFQGEDETGLLDYASKIVMRSADGTKEAAKEIRVNEPLSFEGYKVYQQTYGTAGSVRIDNLANGASEVMHLTESCFLTLNGVDGVFLQALYPGYIRAKDGSVTLITSTSGAYSDPVYDVLSVAEGSMAPVLAFPGEPLTIGDVSFTFLEPTSYPGLRIKYVSPAVLGALYAVFVLMVAGLYLCFFMVPTAVALTEEGYAIVSPKPPTGLIIGLSACLEEEEI